MPRNKRLNNGPEYAPRDGSELDRFEKAVAVLKWSLVADEDGMSMSRVP